MRPATRFLLLAWLVGDPISTLGSPDSRDEPKPIAARVESSLVTASGHIRQFVFDGDPNTYFASTEKPQGSDHLTLVFDQPVPVRSIEVTTGRTDGTDLLKAGSLEVSTDGKDFQEVAKFQDGLAKFETKELTILMIRIKPSSDQTTPLVVREVTLNALKPVATFRYPVEYSIVVAEAPEMKEWAEKAARLCEAWYPKINEEFKSDGFKPSTQVSITLKNDFGPPAAASGHRITGSVKFFKEHPEDLGAMIHETCHVVQRYRGRGNQNPGWLVEGVADYFRFFIFEPGQAGPVDPNVAHYDQSYRTTATFLAYVSDKYDKKLVSELNVLMREGHYKDEAFKTLTGKTVQELDEEWLASLKK